MSPSTIIFGLLAVGFVVLLIAPRLHRRVNARSRAEAELARSRRVAEMRGSPGTVEMPVADRPTAVRARDRLLLRGVRVELDVEDDTVMLVADRSDATVVEQVLRDLDAR